MSIYSDMVNDWHPGDDGSDELESIDIAEIVSETSKAWFIKLREGNKISAHWFPKSQCTLAGDRKSIEVPAWLLDAKGIT